MVAHFHTILKLHQRVPKNAAWLEYDKQFRIERKLEKTVCGQMATPGSMSPAFLVQAIQDLFDLVEIGVTPKVEPNRSPQQGTAELPIRGGIHNAAPTVGPWKLVGSLDALFHQ